MATIGRSDSSRNLRAANAAKMSFSRRNAECLRIWETISNQALG
jgi:hypothetical protein